MIVKCYRPIYYRICTKVTNKDYAGVLTLDLNIHLETFVVCTCCERSSESVVLHVLALVFAA